MNIRTYQPGDEKAQASVYNEAAAGLPGFQPARPEDVRRRTLDRDFDPALRYYAVVDGRVVGYVVLHPNGRVGFPWCRPGHSAAADPLFRAALLGLKTRGVQRAFAAYRADWPGAIEFFEQNGFAWARSMINFRLNLAEMPTLTVRPQLPLTPVQAADLPGVAALVPGMLRVGSPDALARYFLANPYFPSTSVFVMRARDGSAVVAAGMVIAEPKYADPRTLDAAQPCFRLGAFGTEGMQVKRINGLFSFLLPPGPNGTTLLLDLLSHATQRLEGSGVTTLAAQVPSDVPHLLELYDRFFHRQGAFPVYEKALG